MPLAKITLLCTHWSSWFLLIVLRNITLIFWRFTQFHTYHASRKFSFPKNFFWIYYWFFISCTWVNNILPNDQYQNLEIIHLVKFKISGCPFPNRFIYLTFVLYTIYQNMHSIFTIESYKHVCFASVILTIIMVIFYTGHRSVHTIIIGQVHPILVSLNTPFSKHWFFKYFVNVWKKV